MIKIFSTEKSVVLITIIVSIYTTYISFLGGYIISYNDGASHLNIARRVIDSLTPGIAQIGTVWLPLPHLLVLPFVWNDYLWHTALAGSIVSMIAYVISALFLFKTIKLLTDSNIGGLIGVLVLILNPNLLYMQTTPMTESLFIAMLVLATYYLAKYVNTNHVLNLILAGVFVTCSTLIRYDGWFLFIMLLGLIPIWCFFVAPEGKRISRAEGLLFLFASIGGLGIVLWVLWNLAIFGDPLYFISGPYSARAQQSVLESVGQLPTKHNIYLASFYYIWSVIENNGKIITSLATISALIAPFILKDKKQWIVYLAILSPIAFNIVALFMGQSAMNIMQAPSNPGLFNIRYGLMALPAIAFVIGILASRWKFAWLIVPIIAFQFVIFYQGGKPIVLVDALAGLKNTYYTIEASQWLAENYEGGLILTTLASHDAFVARTQLPLKYYVHEGTREYWHNALKMPSQSVEYIALLTFPPDSVYREIKDNPDFKNNYSIVHEYESFKIYKLNDD